MSRVDELVVELAPAGVRFYALGDVAAYSSTRVDASELDERTFVGVDNLLPNKAGKTNASHLPNTARLTAYEQGDVLLSNIRPYLRKAWLADGRGGCSGDVLAVRIADGFVDRLTPEFLYLLLSSDDFFAFSGRHAKGGKMPRGSKKAILRYGVPVPPLAVQREVVRVLNTFTALEAELEAELEARRRQYAYYRDELMSFREARGLPWMTLSELYESSSGLSKNADQFGFGHPFLSFKDVFNNPVVPSELSALVNTTESEQVRFSIKAGDVFVTRTSEDLEGLGMSCAALEDYPKATFNGFTKRLRPRRPGEIEPSYAAYFFRSSPFRVQVASMAVRSTRVSLNDDILGRIRIAVPSLVEQRRIVSILDKFYALVNDLSVGLPAELKARRQQYEYYRDKLLTFEEAAA